MSKSEIARQFFMQGANCAQAVAGAFAKELDMSVKAVFKLASGFGGGFGRRREVCGAVSGMVMVLNHLYGNHDISDKAAKDAHYARVQELLREFEAENHSIICRELLQEDASAPLSTVSQERTAAYYEKRPCAELVACAAGIMEKYIAKNPPAN